MTPPTLPITTITSLCQYESCTEPATKIASGRRDYQSTPRPGYHDVGLYCDTHADAVSDEGFPEYITACPNCRCQFGVN